MPGVTRVAGNANKLSSLAANDVMPSTGTQRALPELVEGQALAFRQAQRERIEIIPSGFMGHVRSFVAVQTGCDHRCTFCSIWQARGPSISLPFDAIRDAVAREIDRGAKEIVLTRVEITDYAGRIGRLCERTRCSQPGL